MINFFDNLSEDSFNFYKHLAKYSDSQYHAVYQKNEHYLIFGKTSITPKVKRALTLSWLLSITCSMYKVTQLFWGEQNNVSDEISCGHTSVILRHNGNSPN